MRSDQNERAIGSPEASALEARFAHRVTRHLSAGSEALPHDLSERLRVARQRALQRAAEVRRGATARPAATRRGAAAAMVPGRWWMRALAALPVVLVLGGLVLIDHRHSRSQLYAAADIDAAILADDLPPDAYTDPAFLEYLKRAPMQ
jgi:hypothetical protein